MYGHEIESHVMLFSFVMLLSALSSNGEQRKWTVAYLTCVTCS